MISKRWLMMADRMILAAVFLFYGILIIINIVLINFGYDIATDVKILSCVLLALNCLLIGNYWRRYQLLLLPEAALDEVLRSRAIAIAYVNRDDSSIC
jgi:hypothetical protein